MNAMQAIQACSETSSMVLKSYIGDLEDAELFTRPGEGCNHLAWQLGHLIASECMLLNTIKPGAAPDLPEGFAECYSKEQTTEDDPAKFHTKAEYAELFDKVRAATNDVLNGVSEEELDAPNPHPDENFRQMFPTVGSMFVLNATHPMMHAGQFVPVRRTLSKPIVI
ncbi:MAG: DinB family protein [Planctomycetota bacterium]